MSGQLGRIYQMTLAQADTLIVTPESNQYGDSVYLIDGYLNGGPGIYQKQSDGTYIFIGGPSSNSSSPVFDNYTSVGNVGGGEDILYSSSIAGKTLFNNGDKIFFDYSIALAATANNKTINLYLGATKVFDGDSIKTILKDAVVSGSARITGHLIKTGATTGRIVCQLIATSTDGTTYNQTMVQESDLAGPIVFTDILLMVLKGIGTADNDIVAHTGTAFKVKAA